MQYSGKFRPRLRPLIGMAIAGGILFASTASAWTYSDLSPSQKIAYDQQQAVMDKTFARYGMQAPKIPLSVYLGVDTRGDNSDITQVQVLNRGGNDDAFRTVTYGQVFKKGDYLPSKALFYSTPSNPSNQGVQSDIKTYWDDGSVQHAVLTFQLDDVPANGSRNLKLFTHGENTKPAYDGSLKIRDLLATSFNASVTIKSQDGQQFTQDARQILQSIADRGGCDQVPDKECKTWLSGNLASEWIIGGRLPGAAGTREEQMGVYFHVRAYASYSGQINSARVDTVLENNFTYGKTTSNLNYSTAIDVGDQQFDSGTIKHYNHARWHKVLWWGTDPDLYVQQDTEYLQSTGAIPEYEDIKPTASFLSKLPASYPIMNHGEQTPNMGETGAQAAIGPLPRWTSLYALDGDPRAFDYMMANDNAVGSYGFHYRDAATGLPVSIEDHPYITLAAYSFARHASNEHYKKDLITGCSSDCSSPYVFNISHHPSIGYVPYLVTGDYYYLEELQFAASYDELWSNPHYRSEAKGYLRGAEGQVRGQAWALRTIAQAAFASPEGSPMKAYFTQMMRNNIDDYTKYYMDHEDKHPLHLLDDYGAVIYPIHGETRVGIAPWQQDFFMWSVANAANLGFKGYDKFAQWLLEFQVGRMTSWKTNQGNGFCWIDAAVYDLMVRPYRNGPEYQTLDEAYAASKPQLKGLVCNSQDYRNHLSKYYAPGEMTGYAYSTTGFPSNLQPALAASVDYNVKGADTAWQVFDSRSVKPRGYASEPQFDIVPRR
jgi:hypothetical protein